VPVNQSEVLIEWITRHSHHSKLLPEPKQVSAKFNAGITACYVAGRENDARGTSQMASGKAFAQDRHPQRSNALPWSKHSTVASDWSAQRPQMTVHGRMLRSSSTYTAGSAAYGNRNRHYGCCCRCLPTSMSGHSIQLCTYLPNMTILSRKAAMYRCSA
jgi:hypothetical protein